jgi:hypothetical protein
VTAAAVIVPTLGRPQNAAPFMESLRATAREARAYVVHDPNDVATIEAWGAAGARLVDLGEHRDLDRPGSFAERINIGYAVSDEPWLLVTGDDVRFGVGWLSNALVIASRAYHVVGTNDLGTPRVVAGHHSPHPLIRREYVDEQGASWDGPKVLAHEGYRHWFVDDEIVTAAKLRSVWAMARSSVVEHLHPWFGKGKTDWVYELGQRNMHADEQLFERRLREHTS